MRSNFFLPLLNRSQAADHSLTNQSPTNSAGFTLVELLVVVAIIGILGSLVLVAINPMQRMYEAQDAQRRSDLATIRDALEAYAANHNGLYPSTMSGTTPMKWCDGCTHPNASAWVNVMPKGSNNWIPNLVAEGYLKRLPSDPTNKPNASAIAGGYADEASYVYSSSGTNYKLMALGTPQTGFNDPSPPWLFCTTSGINGNLTSVSGLKSMVDPARPWWGYAVYSNQGVNTIPPNASACW